MCKKSLVLSSVLLLFAVGPALAWTNVEVGAPAAGSGTFDQATGTWTIGGNGHDIWDAS